MFTVIEWKFPVFFWGPFGCIVILLYGKLSIYNESLEYEKSGIFRLLDHWYAKLSICNESLKGKNSSFFRIELLQYWYAKHSIDDESLRHQIQVLFRIGLRTAC